MNKYNLTKEQLKEVYVKKLTKDVLNEMTQSGELDEISLKGLKNIGNLVGDKAKGLATKASDSVKSTLDKTKDAIGKQYDKASEKVKSSVDAVKREYDSGVMSDLEGKISDQLDRIVDTITKHNTIAKKHGKPTINPQKFLGKFNKVIREDAEAGVDVIFVSGEHGDNVPKMFARKVLSGKIETKNGRTPSIVALLNDLNDVNNENYFDSWGDLLFRLVGVDVDGNIFKFTEDEMGNVIKKK